MRPKRQLIAGNKSLTIGLEQATRRSHCWKRIDLVDKSRFVFQNEIKQLIADRNAIRVVGELSKSIHRACDEQQAWLRKEMLEYKSGPLDDETNERILAFFAQFLSKILVGNVWGRHNYQLYHPSILDTMAAVLISQRKQTFPFINLRATKCLKPMLRQFFSSTGTTLSDDAVSGLTYQLIVFSLTICLDILSQYLELVYDYAGHMVINSVRADYFERLEPAMYDVRPSKDFKFVSLNQMYSLKKSIFLRDKNKTSIWHELLYSEYFNLLGLVFDRHLIERIPPFTSFLFQKYLLRLQIKMREFISTGKLHTIGSSVFLTRNRDHFYAHTGRQFTLRKMAEFITITCRELLNDEELGVCLFSPEYEEYTLTMCNGELYVVEFAKFPTVVRNFSGAPLPRLMGMNCKVQMANNLFIAGQLLRFVLRFAAHTVRIATKVRIWEGRITHLKFDSRMEIPPCKFEEMSPKVLEMAKI